MAINQASFPSRQSELFASAGKPTPVPFDSSHLAPLVPTPIFQTYWRFAAKRQEIYWKRLANQPRPWSDDEILERYKFTNCFRVLDRVSQYLVKNVIGPSTTDKNDQFFRILLFKIFNKIDTWELLEGALGTISSQTFTPDRYGKILSAAFEKSTTLYSAAYIMPSGHGLVSTPRKYLMHLNLLQSMLEDDLPSGLASSASFEEVFERLKSYPTIGDFLAFQYAIDLNYSSLIDFDEMDFVVAGPGAQRGIRKCFSSTAGLSDAEVIRRVTETQSQSFARLGLNFRNLWGHDLKLIDCQNLFCEIDKYTRASNPELSLGAKAPRIKQKFRVTGKLDLPTLPAKWKITPRYDFDV